MIVDSGLVSAVTQSTRALVLAELQKTEREYGAVAMDVPSQSDSENYRWLKAIRGIAEWLTTRVVRNLETEGFRIPNRAFEQTIAIKTEDLRRDKLGLYRPLLQEMGRAAAVFPDELIAEVIAAGHETLCFDGQYFFDTDHPVGTGVVSNKLSLALSADNYGTVRTAMKKQTDEFGKRLKVKPTHLFHATNLEGLARQIVTAEKIGGNDNIHRGTAELLEIADLPDGMWGFFDLSRSIKPVILQTEKPFQFDAVGKEGGDTDANVHTFMTREILYGIEGFYGAGPGIWQLAFASRPAWS